MKHFIGSIVFVDDSEAYVIIDGQQRVTTISILLLALRNAILNGDIVSDDAIIVCESASTGVPEPIDGFRAKSYRYGKIFVTIFRRDS